MTKREQNYANKMNKEKALIFKRWAYTKNRTLKECYNNPSIAKRKVWQRILTDKEHLKGINLTVLTYNTYHFTAAFEYSIGGLPYLRVYTPTKILDIDILDAECYIEENGL